MTTLLIILAVAASNATGGSCAAIYNGTNTAAWSSGHVAYYRDDGDRLTWNRRVPVEVHAAAAALRFGPPGPKVRVACR